MDSLHNQVWSAMTMDGHGSQAVAVDNVYRLTVPLVGIAITSRVFPPSFQISCRQ